jgi:hypothetical protein
MVQTNGKKIDHLIEDDPIVGQQYVCLSFLSPEGIRNCTTRGLKVRGVFSTYEAAQERCKELQSKDKDFDIFIGEVGKWLPWDPDVNSEYVGDQKYQEEELQKLMDGYKKNAIQKTKVEEERKKEMIKKAAVTEKEKVKRRKERMRKKLEQSNNQTEADNNDQDVDQDIDQDDLDLDTTEQTSTSKVGGKKPKEYATTTEEDALKLKEQEIEKEEEIVKGERERLINNKKELNKQQTTVNTIDQQLSKIQALYDNLNKKRAAAEKAAEKSN